MAQRGRCHLPTFTPASRLLYHFNNRTLDPLRGRFLQSDPNATAQPLLGDSAWFDGAAPAAHLARFNAETLFGDGMHLSAFAAAEPIGRSDALGLFIGMGVQAFATGLDSWLSAEGTLEDARQGMLTFFGLKQMLEDYAGTQDADADWASDWSQPDFAPFEHGAVSAGGGVDHAMARRRGANGPSRPINFKLRGKQHPVVYKGKRVHFDSRGYPVFEPFSKKTVKIRQTGDRRKDFALANAEAGYKSTPAGYSWHHHQDGKRMQLVPTALHSMVAHTGGVARFRQR